MILATETEDTWPREAHSEAVRNEIIRCYVSYNASYVL